MNPVPQQESALNAAMRGIFNKPAFFLNGIIAYIF